MRVGETVRYSCGDCQAVFDLCAAPQSEWAEELQEGEEAIEQMEPHLCPFCGAAELKAAHDKPMSARR
jgi:hypothetical protein